MTRRLQTHSDDDGRTVADMSGVDGFAPAPPSGSARDIRDEISDPEERRALIFGATWAGLSIGLVYVVVFAIVIAIMVLAWS